MISTRYHLANTVIFALCLLDIDKFLFTHFEIGVPINLNNIILFLVAGLILSIVHPVILHRNLRNPQLQGILLFIGIMGYLIQSG